MHAAEKQTLLLTRKYVLWRFALVYERLRCEPWRPSPGDGGRLHTQSEPGDTLLFHGCSQEAATNVMATGLLLSFAAQGMLGKGLYGAPDPQVAAVLANRPTSSSAATASRAPSTRVRTRSTGTRSSTSFACTGRRRWWSCGR